MGKSTSLLKKKLTTIAHLIEQEKQRGVPNGRDAIEARYKKNETIESLIDEVEKEYFKGSNNDMISVQKTLHELKIRLNQIAQVPSIKKIKRAQNLLNFQNLRILEIDEHEHEESGERDLIHALVLDGAGVSLFDRFIRPRQQITAQTSYKTGVTSQDLENAPTTSQVWTELLSVLSGGYVVSFDLLLYYLALEEAASHHHLEAPVLIGESLREQFRSYFRTPQRNLWGWTQHPSLEELCKLVGTPLPEPPKQTAYDRAMGLLCVLQAMAQGFFAEAEGATMTDFSPLESDFDEMEFERDTFNENLF